MLTDIRSLTLDMQEIPMVDQGVGDSFNRVLQQELSMDSGNSDQIIDFKEFYLGASTPDQAPGMIAERTPIATWQDYLSHQQIRITTDADPVEPIAADLDAILPSQSKPLPPALPEAAVAPGEALPVGGNSLPDEIAGVAHVLPKDIAVAASTAAASGAELSAGANRASQSVRAVSASTAAIAGGAPVDLATTTRQAAIEQPAPLNPADDRMMAAIRAGDKPVDGDVATRVTKPAIAMPAAAARPQAADESAVASLSSAGRADSRPVGVIAPQEAVARELPLPREPSAAAAMAPAREWQPGNARAPQPQVAQHADSADSGESYQPVRHSAQPLKTPVEAVAPEFAANRGLEMPQAVSQNQAQPALTALSAAVQAPASGSVTAAPAAAPNPLPAQLETMSLARGAEATEWGNGLGDRVSWMINQKQNSATIRLDPPMLGKLDVQVRVADDATTITIQTQNAQTREMIESASVRLRDLLQENGYQNVNVDVSQRQDQQQARAQSGAREQFDQQEDAASDQASDQETVDPQQRPSSYFSGDGILDTFA
jgi:flagellar hook-length control protein FliK